MASTGQPDTIMKHIGEIFLNENLVTIVTNSMKFCHKKLENKLLRFVTEPLLKVILLQIVTDCYQLLQVVTNEILNRVPDSCEVVTNVTGKTSIGIFENTHREYSCIS